MIAPGSIVLVDWRDALPGSGESNKRRPAVVIGSPRVFGFGLPFETVVPLTGESTLGIADAATTIELSAENGCRKTCYLLAWNAQSVPLARLKGRPRPTSPRRSSRRSVRKSSCALEPWSPCDRHVRRRKAGYEPRFGLRGRRIAASTAPASVSFAGRFFAGGCGGSATDRTSSRRALAQTASFAPSR